MSEKTWYKGNLHTHTTKSDGDAESEVVVQWYREHDYDFLVLSDHNHLTLLECGASRDISERPIMIPGEEVSANTLGGAAPVHVGAIGLSRMVEPIDADDVVATIQANVDAILEAGGIASINHPNFRWAFDHEEIKQVTGESFLEVYNGHPLVNVYGAPGKFSYEEIWDGALTAGRVVFGVATDDAHRYYDFSPRQSNPGRGWVMVNAPELTSEAIVEALVAGEFYASTGVTLKELESSRESIHLEIKQVYDEICTTTFTGRGGVTLAEEVGLEATYRIRGDEGYVRATVKSSGGTKAWTQPVFPRD